MTNLVNLQRDQLWLDNTLGSITFPSIGGNANSDGIVYNDIAYGQINSNSGSVVGYVGVMIQQPDGENTPYRVKIHHNGAADRVAIGYATTQTGTNDSLTQVRIIPNDGIFDEVVNIAASSGSNPLFIGLYCSQTSTMHHGIISVQRLNVAPPSYQAAVS
jgi:hypothetical protein